MTSKTTEGKASDILPGEVIRHIPLTDIFVDYDWNVRSKAAIMSDVSDALQDTTIKGEHVGEGTGLRGLVLDLHSTGQDTAIVVRKVEDGKSMAGKKTEKPFELVCGFRRLTATEILNSGKVESLGKPDNKEVRALFESIGERKKAKKPLIPNTADGTILAVIRVLTPKEAIVLNSKENTLRDNLSTQDMVRSIVRMQKQGFNQQQTADALGIGQPYVSRLTRIATLPDDVLAHWRGEKKLPGLPETVQERLTSRQLTELADNTKGQQPGEVLARYISLLSPPKPEDGPDNSSDPVVKRIKDAAALYAGAIRNGVLSADSLSWAKIIGPKKEGFLIDTGKADATKRGEYWDLMSEEFDKALGGGEKKSAKTQKDKDETAAN